MPRTVSEGIHQGLADMQALQSGAIENALKKMQVGIYAQRLRALAGGGDGMNMPGYVYSPLTGTMVRDLSDQEIGRQEKAKLTAENQVTNAQTGTSGQPSTDNPPPKVLGNGGNNNGPLGVGQKVLGVTGDQPSADQTSQDVSVPPKFTQVVDWSGGVKSLKMVPNPDYEVYKKGAEEKQTQQVEQNPKFEAAKNIMKQGAADFGELLDANEKGMAGKIGKGISDLTGGMIAPERVTGFIGEKKAKLGLNPASQKWEQFKHIAAPVFAAQASPRTPTLLTQYYLDAFGPAPQTRKEFEGRVKNISGEITARAASINPGQQFNQKAVNDLADEILNYGKSSGNGQKTGGVLHQDAQGNKAMVYPDGSYEEVK